MGKQIIDLIGELVIAESVVLQNQDLQVPGLKLDNFNKAARNMKKISSDLQNTIMSMRMVPLTNTFQKMNRIVFDVSRKLGKDIEFEMIGDQTEVDKNVSEHISDPLMHLVRNSVDHGIEMPEEREAAGKTEKGKVTLSAKNESGKIWITVQDNGKGLDRAKIIAKARKQELLDPRKLDKEYTDKEVFQFITLPGFSTKEAVTEYSGRGVGMDVVVSNLQSIGGSLEIESELGVGSRMIMKIPLTLAIIDGIVMEVLQQPTVPVVPINSANSLTWMKRATLLAALAAAILLAVYSASRNVVRSSSEAREKLEFVISKGNRLYCVTQAEELLTQLV